MAQCLRQLTALAEDPGLVPETIWHLRTTRKTGSRMPTPLTSEDTRIDAVHNLTQVHRHTQNKFK